MTTKEDLVKCFHDTINIINSNNVLLDATKEAMRCTNLITRNDNRIISNNDIETNISVIENTTFNTAKEYVKPGNKVAVLNFASAVNPGGGVSNGAMAQEECLCRSSNLLPCLKQQHLMKDYYMPHRIANNPMYSDKVIYTRSITVFKTDDSIPKLMPSDEWFNVDVITCAAPNLRNVDNFDEDKLSNVLGNRIDMILNSALKYGIDTIILGAWGCGAFKNPPELVAKAFKQVINEKYKCTFKNIVFAIKKSNNNNFEVFKSILDVAAESIKCDNDKHCFVVKEELTGATEYVCKNCGELIGLVSFVDKKEHSCLKEYIGSTLNGEKITKEWFEKSVNIKDFKKWQKTNKYYGKTFSILGDSISTLEGYIPEEYKAFFEGDVCKTSGVNTPEDTWWGKVINFFGGKLLSNSSYSGSRVTSTNRTFPAAYSEKRMDDLSKNGVSPDVIIIYIGFNDWANGVDLEQENNGCCQLLFPCNIFFDAYSGLVFELKNEYPNAEIICCTLNPTYMSSNHLFAFPYDRAGIHIEKYNEKIKQSAKCYECNLIDLYSYNKSNDTIDGSHPNVDGMNTIASLICYAMADDKGKQFIDFDNCSLPITQENIEIAYVPETSKKKTFCHKCGAQLKLNDKFCMKCGTKVITAERESNKEKENCSEDKVIESKNDNADLEEIIDNRYKLIRQTGKGASAIVYLAQDIKLNRVCAVKIVKKNTYSNKMAAQESLEEVNKMKLLAHVSIPQLYDIYDDDDRLCIVMEFIEGQNLNEIIKSQRNPLDEYTVVSWAKQLCRVLFYLHTLKPPRIFRDLKPANIILQPNGIIKLIDFGTMKNYDESCTEDTVNLGTKGYAAPEQFGGRGQTDARTDIYGLGMTMYHLITGVNPSLPPFEFKSPRYYRKDISVGLERIIMKCIEIERENRYQSAMDLLNDLDKLN